MDPGPPRLRFSIVVPTRSRPVLLDRCLGAMGLLDYPRTGFEVLVVDDGSDPPADTVIARHAARLPLRCLRRAGLGPASARNAGLQQALGEYVVFTDDDCAPDPNWLRAFDEAFSHSPATAFGGRIVDDPENGIFGAASQILVSFLYDDARAARGEFRFFCSNNLALPRETLLELSGFDTSFPLAAAEDRDLCARWLKHWEMQFLSTAIVQHRQFLDLKSFWAQHYRYGRGAYQFWVRRRSEGHSGNRIESLRFYLRMLSYPFSRVPFLKAAAMSALLGLSQLATAAGYLAEREDARTVPSRRRPNSK
jgi:cellulose synthase/poly-beta-1,6-N-acetylglucosamine synthase-like glycosyltransferase